MRHFEEFSNTVRKLVSTAFIYKLWEVIYNRDGGSVVPKKQSRKMVEKKTLHSNTFLKSLADNFEKKNHQESAILALKLKNFHT